MDVTKAIRSLNFSVSEYSTLDTPLKIPYPFIGKDLGHGFSVPIPDSGKCLHFLYYGRTAFREVHTVVKKLHTGVLGRRYNIHGTHGWGKSHLLAALAVCLIQEKLLVVFLPDCRRLLRSFLTYLQESLFLTYPDDADAQRGFMARKAEQGIVDWLCLRTMQKRDKLIIIIDQIEVLDTNEHSIDSVLMESRRRCANWIAELEGTIHWCMLKRGTVPMANLRNGAGSYNFSSLSLEG